MSNANHIYQSNKEINQFFHRNDSITLEQLKHFIAVYELGNLSKAAEAMHKTQPSVSHNLSKLEEKLNAQLVVRQRGKSVSFTEEGHRFYREIAPLIDTLLIKIDETESKNAITIGVPDDLPMEIQLALHQEISAVIDGRLRFLCGFSRDIQAMVTDGRISFGMVKQAADEGNLRYGWAYRSAIRLDTFDKIPLVAGYSGCIIRDLTTATLDKIHKDYYFVYLSSRIYHRTEAVKAGFGVGVFFTSRIAEVPELIPLDEESGFPSLKGFNYQVVGEADTVQKRNILPILNHYMEKLNKS